MYCAGIKHVQLPNEVNSLQSQVKHHFLQQFTTTVRTELVVTNKKLQQNTTNTLL